METENKLSIIDRHGNEVDAAASQASAYRLIDWLNRSQPAAGPYAIKHAA